MERVGCFEETDSSDYPCMYDRQDLDHEYVDINDPSPGVGPCARGWGLEYG